MVNLTMMTNPLIRKTAIQEKNGAKTTLLHPSMPKTPPTKTGEAKPATTHHGATILKTTLVVSSIVATLAGANLIARQDQAAATTPAITVAYAAEVQATTPPPVATVPNLPAATNLADPAVDNLLNTPLAPIPSITIPSVTKPAITSPAPVTRSRSSR